MALHDWLAAHAVTQVAMEAPGVYWQPVWQLLEDDFALTLCNAHQAAAAGIVDVERGRRAGARGGSSAGAALNGLETSWPLNPSLPAEDVAEEWARVQRAQMTAGDRDSPDR